MYQVRSLYGRTKVIFSSPLTVENNCQIKICILIELSDQISEADREKLNILQEMRIEERTFALLFKLLPSKIYHVPLYVAYRCKLYCMPDNGLYAPSLIFDIRAFNFRVNEANDILLPRLSHSDTFDADQVKPDEAQLLNSSDFQFVRVLRLKEHKMLLPSMHANYTVALYPSMKISNCLPIHLRFDVESNLSILVKDGESLNVHLDRSKLKQCKLHVTDYLGVSWVGVVDWERITRNANADLETEKVS